MRIIIIFLGIFALLQCGGGKQNYVPKLDQGVEIKKLYFNSGRTKVNLMNLQDNKVVGITKGYVVNLYDVTDSAIKLMQHSLNSKGFVLSGVANKTIAIKISKLKYSGSHCRAQAEYIIGKGEKKMITAQKMNNVELPDPWEDICNATMRDIAVKIFSDDKVLDYLNR